MPIGKGVVLIGMGERTTRQAVNQVADRLFEKGAAERVVACAMPKSRAAMHLDTVFTCLDHDKVTAFREVVDEITCFSLRPDGKGDVEITKEKGHLFDVYKEALGLNDLLVVGTGGNAFDAEREQWDDGNNVVALEPGRDRRLRPQHPHQHAAAQGRRRGHHHRQPGARPRPRRRALHDLPDPARSGLLNEHRERIAMSFNLKGRSYLKLDDFTQREMLYLLDLSRDLKRAKYAGTERELLRGKEICLIFEKTSTRTRCAFEVAAHDQGAHVTYLDPSGSQIGHKESMKDTARVLGRMFDAIEFRGSGQGMVDDAGEVRRRAGLQRPDRRLAPDADARRHADHGRAFRQAAHADRLRLPRRRPQQHGQLAARARRDDGLRRAHGGAEGEPAARRRAGDREEVGRRRPAPG